MFAANACYLIPLLTVACIGVLLSTATRNSTASVVGAIGFVILLYILAGIPGLEGIKPYLLTEQFQAWHGLLRTPTDWAPDAALAVGLRAVCGPGAVRGLPCVSAAGCGGGLVAGSGRVVQFVEASCPVTLMTTVADTKPRARSLCWARPHAHL